MQPTMRPLAQAVQSQGRGNDSMLIHMTPREVGGLQALALAHGGSLTINPQTGLPEAGFLENLLPTILGAGLMLIPGVNALGAATIVGGAQALRTGDVGKGLLAGLGAFGGANIASGLQAAGASSVAPAASAAAPDAAAAAIQAPVAPVIADQSAAETARLAAANAQAGNISPAFLAGPDQAAAETARLTAANVQAAPTPSMFDQSYQRLQQMGRGVENIFDFGKEGEAARTAFGTKAGLKSLYAAAAPALLAPPPEVKEPEEKINYKGPYTPSERQVRFPGEEERRRTSEFTYFTPSNPVPFAEGGIAALARNRKTTRASMPPRFLAGNGDGMSDSIPAVIGNKQPARLADGEFVVPADVVSHLGNGSSKAGAKKLYAMMDRVRQARTGKKRQAPEINMRRMMPA